MSFCRIRSYLSTLDKSRVATSAVINRQGPEKVRLVIRATQPVVPDELQ